MLVAAEGLGIQTFRSQLAEGQAHETTLQGRCVTRTIHSPLILNATVVPSHEAAHQEIFGSRAWNEWMARVLAGLLGGLSYGWWIAKHNTHHGHPNKVGVDPDVNSRVLVFTPEASEKRRGFAAKLAQYQGIYFIPLLTLEGLNLHVASLRMLFTKPRVRFRVTEIVFITIRHVAFLSLLLAVGMAFAFLGL